MKIRIHTQQEDKSNCCKQHKVTKQRKQEPLLNPIIYEAEKMGKV